MSNPTPSPTAREKIVLRRTLKAPVDEVWRLFTTKDGIASWWGPHGFESKVEHIDVKVGSGFAIAMTAVDPEIVSSLEQTGVPVTSYDRAEYVDVAERARLAWKGKVDFVPDVGPYESHTVVELRDDGGQTALTVTLDAMHDAHWTKMKQLGWEQQLETLEDVLDEG